MAKINILQWLYKHSPANFYSILNGETIIKSINNIFTGYKFSRVFEDSEISSLRKIIRNYKRISTILILLSYLLLIYCFIFPYYELLNNLYIKIAIIVLVAILPGIIIAIMSKLFQLYIKSKYGNFEVVKFPGNDVIENQSFKDFKVELVKIFVLLIILGIGYCFIGSPYKTSLDLISNGKYEKVIKITTIWTKIFPIDSHWYSLRAYAKFSLGDYDGAISDYDKAFDLEKDEYRYMNFDNKIYIKYIQKNYESALNDFDNAIKATENGEQNSLLWDKAQFLYNIGRYNEALSIYNDLISKSAQDRVYLIENRLYYERAQVYFKMGKDKEANSDLETAQKLDLDIEYQNSIPKPNLLLEEI